jgi:hypothetical protein
MKGKKRTKKECKVLYCVHTVSMVARSLVSLVEGHYWFSIQFVEIFWRSIIASYLFRQKPA